jgi:hypothetical protein
LKTILKKYWLFRSNQPGIWILLLNIIFLNPSVLADDPNFGNQIDRGVIEFEEIGEASGLAASRRNPDVLWTHNDSGDEARLFALATDGRHLGVYRIAGIAARDWEDIAVGPGPVEGVSYLYIGDIGDNDAQSDLKYIYRIPEPSVDSSQSPVDSTIAGTETIAFRYPDGSRDAETLMVDPLTKDIYVVSKRESSVRVYRAPYPQSTSEPITLEHAAALNVTLAVGGDISPSGLEILLKTYTSVFYWCRTPSEALWEALKREPLTVPYTPEPQGEAICWSADGMGYYTVSEELGGISAHLYFYPRVVTSLGQIDTTPLDFQLQQNYPNPFNPTTTIDYSLSVSARVKLEIFNRRGRKVALLADGFKLAGNHSVEFHATGLESGVYFYRLRVAGSQVSSQVRKLVVIK